MVQWPSMRLKDHDSVGIIARLKPDVDPRRARDELDAFYQSARRAGSGVGERPSRIALVSAARGLSDLRDEFSLPLAVLMAVVCTVLLIACANVANLMLARGASRRKEIALRMAIGAGRARLFRQVLTESVVFAVAGGTIGFLLAAWGSDALLKLASSGLTPVPLQVHHDARILAFTAGLSLLIGVLFGLAPAMRATKTDLNSALKESSRDGGGRSGTGLKRILVVFQLSLSAVLLVAAGLLARSLHELFRVDPGFEEDRILLVRAYPTIIGYEGARELELYSRLQERLREIPGVRSAGLSRFGFLGGRWSRRISLAGESHGPSDDVTAFAIPFRQGSSTPWECRCFPGAISEPQMAPMLLGSPWSARRSLVRIFGSTALWVSGFASETGTRTNPRRSRSSASSGMSALSAFARGFSTLRSTFRSPRPRRTTSARSRSRFAPRIERGRQFGLDPAPGAGDRAGPAAREQRDPGAARRPSRSAPNGYVDAFRSVRHPGAPAWRRSASMESSPTNSKRARHEMGIRVAIGARPSDLLRWQWDTAFAWLFWAPPSDSRPPSRCRAFSRAFSSAWVPRTR